LVLLMHLISMLSAMGTILFSDFLVMPSDVDGDSITFRVTWPRQWTWPLQRRHRSRGQVDPFVMPSCFILTR